MGLDSIRGRSGDVPGSDRRAYNACRQREAVRRRSEAIREGRISVEPVPCSFCGNQFKPVTRHHKCCSPECGLKAKTRAGRDNKLDLYPKGSDIVYLAHMFGWGGLNAEELREADRLGITRANAEPVAFGVGEGVGDAQAQD